MASGGKKRPWLGGGKGGGWNSSGSLGTWKAYGEEVKSTMGFMTGWNGATNRAMVTILHNIAEDKQKVKIANARIIQF